MRIFSKLALVATLAFMLSLMMVVSVFAEESTTITIFHTNDIHGRVVQSPTGMGMDIVAAIYAATDNAILVDAGDTFHGTPFAALNYGADVIRLMNMAGYSLFTPGNHEFNFGPERFFEYESYADFEFLTGTLYDLTTGELFFSPTAIREIAGVRIGFFGITQPDTAYTRQQENIVGVGFIPTMETARTSIALLQEEGVDLIVAMTHLGSGIVGDNVSGSLAMNFPEIDIIIDAHSHTLYMEGSRINDVLIASTGNHLRTLGRVEIEVINGEVVNISASPITRAEALANFTPVPALTAFIEEIEEYIALHADEEANFVVATIDLNLYEEGIRSEETPLGNLIADGLRFGTGADMAAANGGGLRESLFAGDITIGDIIAVMPFGNRSYVFEITPAVLREVLENAVQDAPSASSRFLQISGFSFAYDPTVEPGYRIISIEVGGQALDLTDTTTVLTIAINDFMAGGGNDYTMFESLPFLGDHGYLHDLVVGYLQITYEYLRNETEGRILQKPSFFEQESLEFFEHLIEELEELIAEAEQWIALEAELMPMPLPLPVAEYIEPVAVSVLPVVLTGRTATVANCWMLNVRESGSPEARAINALNVGDVVTVLDSANCWYEIVFGDIRGWVCGYFLEFYAI